jgi:quercetin dioxygenase-like cupin family protein
MALARPVELEPMISDPDDYRPRSKWRLVTDPGGAAGAVQDLCLVVEEVAVGDRIPLHRHRTDEMIMILEGRAEVTLEEERLELNAGTILFVPKGAIHGLRCAGDTPLRINEVFPTLMIDFEMLDRNPAPGTEARAPSHMIYDAVTGDFWPETDAFEPPPAAP